MRQLALFAFVLLVLFNSAKLSAAEEPAKPADKSSPTPDTEKDKAKAVEAKEKAIESKHTVTIGGKEIHYTARTGAILLRDNEEKPTAAIFYIAYLKDGVDDAAKRPLTFSFNGGPGAASIWLHMGLLGPRRALLADDGGALPPPYKLVDNEYSLLDETDLVFIDPVSTGFSRALKPDDAKKFHGVEADLESVGEFIRLFITRNNRWASPKFVIGESYGTTRAAGLSGELREHQHINVNGIMLVSTVLNFETISFARGNDLPYVLYLPSYTATAWYHKKLGAELQQLALPEVVARAETFATGDYAYALLKGASLPAPQRASALKEYARLTGLSEAFVERADLRVPLSRFAEELLRDEHQVIGRYDGRYKGYVRDHLANNQEYDPSYDAVAGAFASAFNQYVRSELKYESDLPYEILTNVQPWNWGGQNSFLNVAETLAESMTRNPFLKVHVSNGYYDMATPRMATHYTFDHLQIDPALLKNVTQDDYTSGHMIYLNLADLKKQKADLARFIHSAVSAN